MIAHYRFVIEMTTDRTLTAAELDRLVGAIEAQVSEPAPLDMESRRADYQVTSYDIREGNA